MHAPHIGRAGGALAAVVLAATAIAGGAPAHADYGDPLFLGYLQPDVLSGARPYRVIDPITSVAHWENWYTTLVTNPGETCPAGTTQAQLRVYIDGVNAAQPLGATLRATLNSTDGYDSFTPVPSDHIIRAISGATNPNTSALADAGVLDTGGVLEVRHTCQTSGTYDPATNPYYSFTIDVAAGGSWQVRAQVADSAEADITVTVPQAEGPPPAPEGLKLTVKPGPVTLTGGVRSEGQVWTASGTLGTTTVDDDRQDAQADDWSLTGVASDFANAGATESIDAANLGWAPAKISGAGDAGASVAPGVDGGLGTAKAFGTGEASDSEHVTTSLQAPLTLDVPATVPADTYVATLTLTLI